MRGSGFLQNSEPKRDLCDNGLTEVLKRWNDSAETVRRMSNCQTKGDLWVPRVNSIAILAKYVVPLQNKILKAFILTSGLFSMLFSGISSTLHFYAWLELDWPKKCFTLNRKGKRYTLEINLFINVWIFLYVEDSLWHFAVILMRIVSNRFIY